MLVPFLAALALGPAAPAGEDAVFAPDARLTVVAAGGVGGEGPAWDPDLGLLCSGNDNVNRVGPDGAAFDLEHDPRLRCEEFGALRAAAAAGLGVALLPDHVCWPDLDAGRLVRLFPEWHAQEGIVHLVFTTRRGLPPAVRAFIDHLAVTFQSGVLAPRK